MSNTSSKKRATKTPGNPTATVWHSLSSTIADFRGECSELEQLVLGLFQQVEGLHHELADKSRKLESAEQRLQQREVDLEGQRGDATRIDQQFQKQEEQFLGQLTELRQAQEGLLTKFEESCAGAGRLEEELAEVKQQRDDWRSQLDDARGEVSRLACVAGELAEARTQIADLREQVARLEASATQQAGDGDPQPLLEILRKQEQQFVDRLDRLQQALADGGPGTDQDRSLLLTELAEAKQQRDQWREQLDETQEKVSRLAMAAAELGDIRTELTDLREELAQRSGESGVASTDASVLDELLAGKNDQVLQRLDDSAQLQQRLLDDPPVASEDSAQWDQERATLEAELELLRGRAAELYETVSQQQDELAHHREGTDSELRRMRELLERSGANVPAPQPEPVATAPAAAAPAADPVVNSVMAQFAKLQKDAQRRRK